MSDDQQESSDKPNRTRKIVRSAATAERPGFETPPPASEGASGEGAPPASADGAPPAGEAGAAAGRKWDVRAERTGGPPPSRRPAGGGGRRPGDRPPRDRGERRGPPSGERAPGEARPEGEAAGAEGAPRDRGPSSGDDRRRERRRFDDVQPRRPGVSGGRAMPSYGGSQHDRSSPDFIDKWLSTPPRKPEERDRFKKDGPREGAPGEPRPSGGGDRGPRDRDRGGPEGRRDARRDRRDAPPVSAPAQKAPPPPPPSQKLPTLHETILVGLPKVAAATQAKAANKPKTAKEALAAKTAHSTSPQKAQKPKREEATEEREGEIMLDPSWIIASGDKAVAVLREAGPAAEPLVESWIQTKNVDAIAAASRSEELTGAARKAARRAVGVLRSRGVTIPEPSAAKEPAARAAEEEVVEATFNPPDGRGSWSMTISKRRGGERAHIAEVIVREGVGVTNASSGWMSRSAIKEAHQRIADATGIAPASVSPEWVRWRVQRALEDNAKSGQLVPLNLERCKDLLEPPVEVEPPHPTSELASGLEDGPADAPVSLHAEPEFRGWLPDPKAVEDVVRRVGAKLTQEDAGDQSKVDEVLKEEMKLATDRYFTPEQRVLLATRMRDAAVTIRSRSGDDRAKDVLRAAKAIENAGLITSPPSEIEFLRVFFQKGIAVLAQQTGGQLRVPVSATPPST